MTGPTHVVIALAGSLAITAATGQAPPGVGGWAALVIGSLAPDIDSGGGTICRPGSLFGRILPRPIRWLLDQVGLFVSNIIRAILGHRGATHWPIFGIIFVLLGYQLGYGWLAWFGVGYLLHILGDFCTVSGVPLLGPVWTRDIKWSPVRTGTWSEFVIALALWGAIFYYGWSYLPAEAQYWLARFGSSARALIGGI